MKVAAARRNLEHCQDGLFSCDPTELTEAEAKAVRTTFEGGTRRPAETDWRVASRWNCGTPT